MTLPWRQLPTVNRKRLTANRDNLQLLWRNRKMYRGRAGDVSVELHRHRLITEHLSRRNLPVFYIRQVRMVSNEDTLQISEDVDVALVFENQQIEQTIVIFCRSKQ